MNGAKDAANTCVEGDITNYFTCESSITRTHTENGEQETLCIKGFTPYGIQQTSLAQHAMDAMGIHKCIANSAKHWGSTIFRGDASSIGYQFYSRSTKEGSSSGEADSSNDEADNGSGENNDSDEADSSSDEADSGSGEDNGSGEAGSSSDEEESNASSDSEQLQLQGPIQESGSPCDEMVIHPQPPAQFFFQAHSNGTGDISAPSDSEQLQDPVEESCDLYIDKEDANPKLPGQNNELPIETAPRSY